MTLLDFDFDFDSDVYLNDLWIFFCLRFLTYLAFREQLLRLLEGQSATSRQLQIAQQNNEEQLKLVRVLVLMWFGFWFCFG